MNIPVEFDNLRWESDWNGDEVGYPDVPVVGLYAFDHPKEEGYTLYLYLDTQSDQVLEFWTINDDEM